MPSRGKGKDSTKGEDRERPVYILATSFKTALRPDSTEIEIE